MNSERMHSDLYKDRMSHSKEIRQAERRAQLLCEQRNKRNELCDENRDITEKPPPHEKKHFFQKRIDNKLVKNKLQLSEWWIDRPDDYENWIARPCPKGTRCIVVAANGRTETYNKRGGFILKFNSNIPGSSTHRQLMTMLDCIYVSETSTFYVIDVLVYKDQDFRNCDANFRFYWIKSRLEEEKLDQITKQNQRSFKWIETCECENETTLNTYLSKYPIWPMNLPQLDGILFYHKESAYVVGETPLVLWLYAFMLPEILFVPDLNEQYLHEKPSNYTNYLDFIEEFNRKLYDAKKAKQLLCTNRNKSKMECEINDECNSTDIVYEQMNFELEMSDDT